MGLYSGFWGHHRRITRQATLSLTLERIVLHENSLPSVNEKELWGVGHLMNAVEPAAPFSRDVLLPRGRTGTYIGVGGTSRESRCTKAPLKFPSSTTGDDPALLFT